MFLTTDAQKTLSDQKYCLGVCCPYLNQWLTWYYYYYYSSTSYSSPKGGKNGME